MRALPLSLSILVLHSLLWILPVQAAPEKRPVKIGVIAPLTGPLAMRGEDVTRLLEILAPRLTRKSQKYIYKFIFDDGRCGLGSSASTIAKKFIKLDKIKFLITACSGETLQAGPIAQKNGVLTFAVLSTHQDIKKIGDYVFRTYVDIEQGIKSYAAVLKKESGGRIAIFTEENAFTFGIRDLLHRYLEDDIVYSDDFSGDTTDYKAMLIKARANRVGALYFNCAGPYSLVNLVVQARQLGFVQPIFSYDMAADPVFISRSGSYGDGIKFLHAPVNMDLPAEFIDLMKEYRKRFPEGPSMEFLVRDTYDAAMAIFSGIEKLGPQPTAIKEYLKTYRARGALGEVSFDENGDIENISFVLKELSKGSITVIDDFKSIGEKTYWTEH